MTEDKRVFHIDVDKITKEQSEEYLKKLLAKYRNTVRTKLEEPIVEDFIFRP